MAWRFGSASTNPMAGPSNYQMVSLGLGALGGIAGAANSFAGASNQKQALEFKAKLSKRNAEIIEQQKEELKAAGQRSRHALRRAIRGKSQRLAPKAGRNNLRLSGSVVDTLMSTEVFLTADLGQAKINEASAIYGLDIKKFNANAQGALLERAAGRISPGQEAFSTFLGSAGSTGLNFLKYQDQALTGTASIKRALGIL